MRKEAEINIPAGGHDAVLLGDLKGMVETWSEVAVDLDEQVMTLFAFGKDRNLLDVIPTIAYAHVAKAAFGLCVAANIATGQFDATEFGKRCEAIAREQVLRYRNKQTAETA